MARLGGGEELGRGFRRPLGEREEQAPGDSGRPAAADRRRGRGDTRRSPRSPRPGRSARRRARSARRSESGWRPTTESSSARAAAHSWRDRNTRARARRAATESGCRFRAAAELFNGAVEISQLPERHAQTHAGVDQLGRPAGAPRAARSPRRPGRPARAGSGRDRAPAGPGWAGLARGRPRGAASVVVNGAGGVGVAHATSATTARPSRQRAIHTQSTADPSRAGRTRLPGVSDLRARCGTMRHADSTTTADRRGRDGAGAHGARSRRGRRLRARDHGVQEPDLRLLRGVGGSPAHERPHGAGRGRGGSRADQDAPRRAARSAVLPHRGDRWLRDRGPRPRRHDQGAR